MIHKSLIPAAQYVRMSTEDQEYSIENQKAAIREYAQRQGFEIVRTYEDPGESGLQLKQRAGLRQLLADVVTGEAKFRRIIVLDVSRWGRFQDADEAAHYEFVCKKAGINVIYCAEDFNNEGSVSDYFAKVLKRTSAAEYSRELSIKSLENHKRTVQLGFRVGGQPGYGFRRMAVGSDGRLKGMLTTGESKVLMSDRVTLVHGPQAEVDCVRLIFRLCLKGMSCFAIANELNRRGFDKAGREWRRWMIADIVTNPKYAGKYVWNRTTQHLRSSAKANKSEQWIVKEHAFPPIVPQCVFHKAQLHARTANKWSDDALLQKLRLLLKKKGYLSERLIQKSAHMPSVATYHRRFGNFQQIYKLVRFTAPPALFVRSESRQRTQALRAGLIKQLEVLFPGRLRVFHLQGRSRQILELDGRAISLLICPSVRRARRAMSWSLIPVLAERQYTTLICRLNSTNDVFQGFHLFQSMDRSKPTGFTEKCVWLARAERVNSLEALGRIATHVQQIPLAVTTIRRIYEC